MQNTGQLTVLLSSSHWATRPPFTIRRKQTKGWHWNQQRAPYLEASVRIKWTYSGTYSHTRSARLLTSYADGKALKWDSHLLLSHRKMSVYGVVAYKINLQKEKLRLGCGWDSGIIRPLSQVSDYQPGLPYSFLPRSYKESQSTNDLHCQTSNMNNIF